MTPSAEAQPTHEPVSPWSPTVHHDFLRSTEAGRAAVAPRAPEATACSNFQSCAVSLEGTTLQMRLMLSMLLAPAFAVVRFRLVLAFGGIARLLFHRASRPRQWINDEEASS